MSIQFTSDSQKKCFQRVARFMHSLFGEQAQFIDGVPEIFVRNGTAEVHLRVLPWNDDALLIARAYIASCIDLTPDLMTYLLKKNNDITFGAFGVDNDGSIFLEHSIVGSSCNKAEVKATVLSVLTIADEYDGEILERWGGKEMLHKKQMLPNIQ